MMLGHRLFRSAVLLFVLACAEAHGSGALREERIPAFLSGSETRQYSTSISDTDFDGDSKPDLTIGSPDGPGYTVEIRLTSRQARTSLYFAGGGPGIRIFAYDVDRDNCQDLVVTNATSLLPLAVYLGDGKGNFQQGKPWSVLPFGLESPNRYEPAKATGSLVCVMPQTRWCLDLQPDSTFEAPANAGGWIRVNSKGFNIRRYLGSRNPRSPPPRQSV